jgi:hypothetical protein
MRFPGLPDPPVRVENKIYAGVFVLINGLAVLHFVIPPIPEMRRKSFFIQLFSPTSLKHQIVAHMPSFLPG